MISSDGWLRGLRLRGVETTSTPSLSWSRGIFFLPVGLLVFFRTQQAQICRLVWDWCTLQLSYFPALQPQKRWWTRVGIVDSVCLYPARVYVSTRFSTSSRGSTSRRIHDRLGLYVIDERRFERGAQNQLTATRHLPYLKHDESQTLSLAQHKTRDIHQLRQHPTCPPRTIDVVWTFFPCPRERNLFVWELNYQASSCSV